VVRELALGRQLITAASNSQLSTLNSQLPVPMHIFPAIDLKQNNAGQCRCVRLLQGRADAETVFDDDPAAFARRWQDAGAKWLHVVDLDGAFRGRPTNTEAIRAVADAVSMTIEVGGGIRDDVAAATLLEDVGVERVIIGTRALDDLDGFTALCRRWPGRIVGGIDARDGRVALAGWTRDSGVDALVAARRLAQAGAAAIIFTDIATDGMLTGPNVDATRRVAEAVDVPVVASGGVSSLEDVRRLAELPLQGAIIGKALYTGAIDLREAIAAASG
jgi:phosphoribosylformimino-5-aminoimidazole carboxamide ribotide isomerase